jgi:hypothetical protein
MSKLFRPFGHIQLCKKNHLLHDVVNRSGLEPDILQFRNIHKNPLQVLLPVPLPILVPTQGLTQSQLIAIKIREPHDFTSLASQSVTLDRQWSLSRRTHYKTALRSYFSGYGFGPGSVTVLVTIANVLPSPRIT